MGRKLMLAGTAACWIAFALNSAFCLMLALHLCLTVTRAVPVSSYATRDDIVLLFKHAALAGVAWLTHRWGLVLLERECRSEDK